MLQSKPIIFFIAFLSLLLLNHFISLGQEVPRIPSGAYGQNNTGYSPHDPSAPGNPGQVKENDSLYQVNGPPSDQLAKRKFSLKRRIYQNLVTRDNYYFNAQIKLKQALQRIIDSRSDDFDSLLSMYPYSLEDLVPIKNDLDSIIYKSSIGIEIHDPRGKWMDNLYLLVGEAYYYKMDFRNALLAFQFINTRFAPGNTPDYPAVIGTRGEESTSQISISTPETKRSLLHHHLPSRNDALIWMIRTLTDSGRYNQAQSLINILQTDPQFPPRLAGRLAEVKANFFFRQGQLRRAIPELTLAARETSNPYWKARWEFLLGQLYQKFREKTPSIDHYQHAIHFTRDPLMAFYADLQIAKVRIENDTTNIDTDLAVLLNMSRKNKYERYRGIIFYQLAQLENGLHHPVAATRYLHQSINNLSEDTHQKFLSFQLMADINYDQGNYLLSKLYYDSASALMPASFKGADLINTRRKVLLKVVHMLNVIQRQDSLQYLARLPEDQRVAILSKILVQLKRAARKRNREANRLAQIPSSNLENPFSFPDQGNANFQGNGHGNGVSPSANWYFYNPTLKSQGYEAFLSRWGNRTLADNWRRAESEQETRVLNNPLANSSLSNLNPGPSSKAALPLSIQGLESGLPLTPAGVRQSNDSLVQAYLQLGKYYYFGLDNLPAALEDYETLQKRFPDNPNQEQVAYFLYFLYGKSNQPSKRDDYKKMILTRFPNGKYADFISTGPQPNADSLQHIQISRLYDSAYLDYLQGRYSVVISQYDSLKKRYPSNYLQPKLDLLHAMALIKGDSSVAGEKALRVLVSHYSKNEVAQEALAILNALDHQQAIIDYLTHLQETASSSQVSSTPRSIAEQQKSLSSQLPGQNNSASLAQSKNQRQNPLLNRQAASAALKNHPPSLAEDTSKTQFTAGVAPTGIPITPYTVDKKDAYFVVVELEKTDKNLLERCLQEFAVYNLRYHLKDQVEVSPFALTPEKVMLIFRLFPDQKSAVNYYQELLKKAPTVIIPDVNIHLYQVFYISRKNFILLNQTKDYNGYANFFQKNYVK
ncbi:MAG: type IX secretion system periplasmic lipoprotein PorW/SprE [Chitinophagaceae bacterium]